MTNLSESEFERLVTQHYRFLVDDFGFTIKKTGNWSFTLDTGTALVTVFSEQTILLTVALQPAGPSAAQLIKKHVPVRKIEVIVISMCLDPNLQYKVARIDKNPVSCDIPLELERRALLLKKYCGKMLYGDFSEWGEIRQRMVKRRNEILNI